MKRRFTVVDSGITSRAWAVNKRRQIFTYIRGKWQRISGGLKHISSGQAGVWGTTGSGSIYFRTSVTARRPKGRYWKRVSGKLKQIDSGPRGIVCGVNKQNKIYCRSQISQRYKRGRGWIHIPGKLKYISCGEYGYWGVSSNNHIYFREGVSRSNLLGIKWRRVAGRLRQLEAGKYGQVWGLSPGGKIYVRTRVTASKPWGIGWKRVKTRKAWRHVTIGIGAVFSVASNGHAYRTFPATGGIFVLYKVFLKIAQLLNMNDCQHHPYDYLNICFSYVLITVTTNTTSTISSLSK